MFDFGPEHSGLRQRASPLPIEGYCCNEDKITYHRYTESDRLGVSTVSPNKLGVVLFEYLIAEPGTKRVLNRINCHEY